jgi:SSS family solute:Na+ symporter
MEALATLHARLPKDFFQIFGSNQLPDFTWYYVLAVSVVAGVTVITQPNQLVTNAAARDEMSARVGMVAGSFIKRLCTILWAGCGLICSLVYAGSIRDSDLVWGHASRDLLGGAGLGLVGLMLAAMLSALMAVSNSVMLTISGLVTANLYKPLRPGRTDSHYIAVGRIAGVTFLAGSALIATQFDSLLVILKLNWEYFAIFSAAFWLGLKWRRANRAGAWASILFSFLALYAVPVALTAVFPTIRSSPALALQTRPGMVAHSYLTALERRPQHETYIPAESIFWSQGLKPDVSGRLSGQGYPFLDLALLQAVGFDLQSHSKAFNETMRIVLRLLLPFVILALVSPAAPRDDARMLDRFYSKMRTRVDGRGHDSDVAKVESTMADPQRLRSLLLFPNSDWEIYRWNRADTIGILASIAFVFVVLGLLVGALSLGS